MEEERKYVCSSTYVVCIVVLSLGKKSLVGSLTITFLLTTSTTKGGVDDDDNDGDDGGGPGQA